MPIKKAKLWGFIQRYAPEAMAYYDAHRRRNERLYQAPVSAVRAALEGRDVVLITPGVRPAGSDTGDQRRVATPREALDRGADLLVIGRPITGAADVAAAAAAIAGDLGYA